MSEPATITLAIISHTNIGKTTLARTLLRRDIGEVRDQDHVTLETESNEMLRTASARLVILDSPGFGGVHAAAILRRLRREGDALGWLLHHVVDRVGNRSLFSSMEAARAVRAEADAVLYLVNAKERPEDAGYVEAELKLLAALGKPVILIINQVERESERSATGASIKMIEDAWRVRYGRHEAVCDVLVLDAFSRVWLQELRVLDAAASALGETKKSAMRELRSAYTERCDDLVRRCAEAAAGVIHFAMLQNTPAAAKRSNEDILNEMYRGLQEQLDDYVARLMAAYSLEAKNTPELERDLAAMRGLAQKKVSEGGAGVVSAVLSGAFGGAAAGALPGGLTLGGGLVVGFILGGIGGYFAARGFNTLFRQAGMARWSVDFLFELFSQLLFFFLLVAHHGRGKGLIDFQERVDAWREVIGRVVAAREPELKGLFKRVMDGLANGSEVERTSMAFSSSIFDAISILYPERV